MFIILCTFRLFVFYILHFLRALTGLFSPDREEYACLFPDYFLAYTSPAVLQSMIFFFLKWRGQSCYYLFIYIFVAPTASLAHKDICNFTGFCSTLKDGDHTILSLISPFYLAFFMVRLGMGTKLVSNVQRKLVHRKNIIPMYNSRLLSIEYCLN